MRKTSFLKPILVRQREALPRPTARKALSAEEAIGELVRVVLGTIKVDGNNPQGQGISENGYFRDLGPSWGLEGGLDSQNYQNYVQNDPRDTQIRQTHTTKHDTCAWTPNRVLSNLMVLALVASEASKAIFVGV